MAHIRQEFALRLIGTFRYLLFQAEPLRLSAFGGGFGGHFPQDRVFCRGQGSQHEQADQDHGLPRSPRGGIEQVLPVQEDVNDRKGENSEQEEASAAQRSCDQGFLRGALRARCAADRRSARGGAAAGHRACPWRSPENFRYVPGRGGSSTMKTEKVHGDDIPHPGHPRSPLRRARRRPLPRPSSPASSSCLGPLRISVLPRAPNGPRPRSAKSRSSASSVSPATWQDMSTPAWFSSGICERNR